MKKMEKGKKYFKKERKRERKETRLYGEA